MVKRQLVEEQFSVDTKQLKSWLNQPVSFFKFNWFVDGDLAHTSVMYWNEATTTLQLGTGSCVFMPKLYIKLVSTVCNYGEARWWFVCPSCLQRKRRLFTTSFESVSCSKCLNLAYVSQNKGGWEKVLGKVRTFDELKRRRVFYAGKLTKAYRKFEQSETKWSSTLESLNKVHS